MTNTKLVRLLKEQGVRVKYEDGLPVYRVPKVDKVADFCLKYEFRIGKLTQEQTEPLHEI